jgi:hypothetical protein
MLTRGSLSRKPLDSRPSLRGERDGHDAPPRLPSLVFLVRIRHGGLQGAKHGAALAEKRPLIKTRRSAQCLFLPFHVRFP